MVSGQDKELPDGLRLDSPYPVDKGLARGTILEGYDNLVDGHIGELSAAFGEAVYVVAETLTLLLLAVAKLAGVTGSDVGALEVPYEGVLELSPVVDPPPREVLEPGSC
jgi:hypothetical protein